jgi:hypothetical protein
VLVVLLVVAAAVAGVMLLEERDEPSGTAAGGPGGAPATGHATTGPASETADDPTTTASSPSSGTPAPGGGAERAVADYYALLPEDTAAAWDRLSPALQDDIGGYGKYDGFWRTVDDVTVDDTSSDGGVVTVDLTYASADGGVESETRELEMTRTGDGWLVTGDSGP